MASSRVQAFQDYCSSGGDSQAFEIAMTITIGGDNRSAI